MEQFRNAEVASTSRHYAGPGHVECDSCTKKKRKAVNSCLVCLTSYCEDHLKPHHQSPAFKKHKLVEACAELQEKICSQHDKPIDIYCRTDRSFICYVCMMDKHKDHDTVLAEAERTEKQTELEQKMKDFQQMKETKTKRVQELKSIDSIKKHTQAAVDDTEMIFTELISSMEKKRTGLTEMRSQAAVDESERTFTELISSMEKKRSEVKELIRAQEEAELSLEERLLKQLEQEIADLERRLTELEQLSHTQDHVQFLKRFPFLCASLTMKISMKETNKANPSAAAVQVGLSSEPKTREDFLKYFHYLTLDPNSAHQQLILSEKSRVLTRSKEAQQYCEHPERFDSCAQVLCKESMCGRCYWEVEWKGMGADVSVAYKNINRKGESKDSGFGFNSQSWNLQWYPTSVSFRHNNIETKLPGQSPSRIGVYVDHSAGNLSFYSVSDSMRLLHKVQTKFKQPLYAGFRICYYYSTIHLCDPELHVNNVKNTEVKMK